MELEDNEELTIQQKLAKENIDLLYDLYKYCANVAKKKDNVHIVKFLSLMQSQLTKIKEEKKKAINKELGISSDNRQRYFKYWY